ncbi:MAG TPA: hypothetical protein VGL10_08925 [Gammaproteobacteria bacterium]
MKSIKFLFVLLMSITVLWTTASAQSAETETPVDSNPGLGILGWTITPGIGVRLLDIDVTSKRTGGQGNITNDGSFSNPIYFSLDIESPTLTFGRFGATVRAHSTSLKLDHQRFSQGNDESADDTDNSGDIHDVGTEVKAKYNYLMPTLFYRWTDVDGGDLRLGLGYGKWDADFSGNMVLTKDFSEASSLSRTSISGKVDGKKGLLLFWQLRFKRGLLEFSINEVDFENENFEFNLSELNMMYGYYFEL